VYNIITYLVLFQIEMPRCDARCSTIDTFVAVVERDETDADYIWIFFFHEKPLTIVPVAWCTNVC